MSGVELPFSPAVSAWFDASFEAPTDAQRKGWPAIAAGRHTLLLAPTGSGKTLAAFLAGIDRLTSEAPPPQEQPRQHRHVVVGPDRRSAAGTA